MLRPPYGGLSMTLLSVVIQSEAKNLSFFNGLLTGM
jgi:hypothetical protein